MFSSIAMQFINDVNLMEIIIFLEIKASNVVNNYFHTKKDFAQI